MQLESRFSNFSVFGYRLQSWYHFSSQVIPKSDTDYNQTHATPFEVNLSIPRVQVGHYGNYSCTVGNVFAERTWNFTLFEAGEASAF